MPSNKRKKLTKTQACSRLSKAVMELVTLAPLRGDSALTVRDMGRLNRINDRVFEVFEGYCMDHLESVIKRSGY